MGMKTKEKAPAVVIGVDESGWGAWAGPFWVAACVLRSTDNAALANEGVRDSKDMTPAQRSAAMNAVFAYAVSVTDTAVAVDTIKSSSPAQAHADAVFTCVKNAVSAAVEENVSMADILVVIDGNPIGNVKDQLGAMDIQVKWVHKAESKYVAVAAASIAAKCFRDDAMIRMDEDYPDYGFAAHKGYGSSEHQAALKKLGPTPQHRDVNIKSKSTEEPRKETSMQAETEKKAKAPKKAAKGTKAEAKAPTKAAKKPAKGAATKSSATKATTKAAAKSEAAENFSRNPEPMLNRLKDKVVATHTFAEHTVSRAQKFSDKVIEKKAQKASALITKALEALN